MLDKLVSKYALSGLLEIDGCAFAIADKDQKIIWYNKSFKEFVTSKVIKGKTLSDLIKVQGLKNLSSYKRKISFHLPGTAKSISINPLRKKDKTEGYFISITVSNGFSEINNNSDFIQDNLLFQKELEDILNLLIKESSLPLIAGEILKRSVEISKSGFGYIVFYEDNRKFTFLPYDPDEIIKNKPEVEKEIKSNFSFITKWFALNKRSLLALNVTNNIGFNLTETFQSEALIISPCFIENKLLAAVILGKMTGTYSVIEINHNEQFAALLSYAINSIRTKELNNALENRLRQSQKLETIGKLTSGMAHDFSNLLSSIFGSLNLLKKRISEPENVTRLLDNIENCAVRAKDLTKGLLSYGKPTPKRKEQIKPNILLAEISKVITQTFPKTITLENKIEPKLHDILGNGTEIYQILLNLCVNAKEAIEGKGKIILSAKNLHINDKNHIDYPMLQKGNYVKFSVRDTGSGISEENLEKIFDPYFSTKEKETGSGLGLYVSYGIIKAHNGHIEVTSEIGKGTEFDVYIPSYEPTTEVIKSPPSEKIILLADDEIMLRDLLAELLETNGYNVIKVVSGIETLKVLTEEIKVDLVIIDYNMPEMNGIECIQQIRKLNFNMPIILSSGSLTLNEDMDLTKMGITSTVTKPYEFDTMLSTIQKLI